MLFIYLCIYLFVYFRTHRHHALTHAFTHSYTHTHTTHTGQPSPCTRFIGLGSVSSSKEKNKKWLHALSLEPIVHMSRADLMQIPVGTTDCPYVQVGTTANNSHNSSSSGSGSGNGNINQLKRSRIEPPQGEINFHVMRTYMEYGQRTTNYWMYLC